MKKFLFALISMTHHGFWNAMENEWKNTSRTRYHFLEEEDLPTTLESYEA